MCRKIRYDGEFKKFCKTFWKLNKAALFSFEIFLDFATIAFSFLCGKYCLIID